MNKKAVVYFQSGGPTAVINSSLCGWLEEALKHSEIGEIYGARYGVLGLIHDDLIDLTRLNENDHKLMRQTPGAVLGSARLKLKDNKDGYYDAIAETVKKHNIGAIFVNGGNDSMDTCAKLGEYFKGTGVSVIGVPKTVDNDLMGMDHCPGFPSAVRSVMADVKAISVDCKAYEKGRVTIVETMGRDAGWIAASTALIDQGLAPDLVYLPEMEFNIDDFLAKVKDLFEKQKKVLVVISEGIAVPRNDDKVDSFGHVNLEGAAGALAKIVEEKLDIRTRSIAFSLLTRADWRNISRTDSDEAYLLGKEACLAYLDGKTAVAPTVQRVSNKPYKIKIETRPTAELANFVSTFPKQWIKGPGKIDEAAYAVYLLPLIDGDLDVSMEHGIPKALKLF